MDDPNGRHRIQPASANTRKEKLEIRAEHIENKGQFEHKWLNEQNEFEAAYVKAMGGHKVSHSDQYRYFTISETAQHELIRCNQ